jgi:twitching motility protein PilT
VRPAAAAAEVADREEDGAVRDAPPLDLLALLRFMHDHGASDMHLSAGAPPILRLHGELKKVNHPALSPEDVAAVARQVMDEEQRDTYAEELELDFSLALDFARFRVNAFQQRRGPALVLRIIPSRVLSLEELGLPSVLAELTMREKGLILVTGPTGSGKSTTLAAMIDAINTCRRAHIITIEDPIEFVHDNKCCLINQREVGGHTRSFANALRSALREDPDVVLVGELRDLETTQLAITAAETGHLVLGTMHTNSAAKTCDRIVDIFPSERQEQVRTMFSESLAGIAAQLLLPRAQGPGRVAALEVLVGTSAVRNLIREQKVSQLHSTLQTGAGDGMVTMDQSLQRLVEQGRVAREEARKHAIDPKAFAEPRARKAGDATK